ncbi:MAG TPA: NAD(P)/FAD-dependent oxidoreductase [Candidatus Eisenbacteria bacterium]|nr:NAD(P)/FAD-dependent oxidoreductase [Candidatus Eisenbacteria bacterium]
MPRPERLDALILGAGVAGLSAALWLRDLGVECAVFEEARQPGGQLHEIHAPIVNHLMALGWEGSRVAAGVLSDARSAELPLLVGSPVTSVRVRLRTIVHEGRTYQGRTMLIATGLRRRRLGVPGERELLGRGVSLSANRDRTQFSGRPVVVIGGGTAAVEDALLCAEVGSPVTLLHRSTRWRARGDFLARARQERRIRIVTGARVRRIVGDSRVQGVEYRVRGTVRPRVVAADGVFVRVGWEPRSEILRGQIRLDRAGYVVAGPGGVTSARGVFAAGDVCSPRWPSIANAAGQGANAAMEMARMLRRIS